MKLTKLKRYIFILLLILLPTQLGYHFWPEWSYINGIRVDYFSPTLYLTDILIFILVILEGKKMLSLRSSMTVILLFAVAGINIYFSLSPAVSIYKWLKVAEMGFLAIWIARNFKFQISNLKFLLVPVFYESLLAIWQFINQASVGGPWYWLGERIFNGGTPGTAKTVIFDQLVLRPYGTLPHPNVLAGFLIVSLLVVLKYSPRISRKIAAVVLGLAVLVLFLTPSHGNLILGFNLRQQLNTIAVEQWVKSPIVGTGLGTSPLYPRKVQNYALVHQPTHNIYLLILAETGILGILGGLGILGVAIKKRSIPLLAILILGLFDHYFLTLQQGQLILALILGLALGRIKRN